VQLEPISAELTTSSRCDIADTVEFIYERLKSNYKAHKREFNEKRTKTKYILFGILPNFLLNPYKISMPPLILT
jgi:hypothetical protein